MTNDRDWQVSYGYYGDDKGYSGPSTFLAGLKMARLVRKNRAMVDVWDMNSYDADWDDDCYIGTDTRTEDEEGFFLGCVTIGIERRSK